MPYRLIRCTLCPCYIGICGRLDSRGSEQARMCEWLLIFEEFCGFMMLRCSHMLNIPKFEPMVVFLLWSWQLKWVSAAYWVGAECSGDIFPPPKKGWLECKHRFPYCSTPFCHMLHTEKQLFLTVSWPSCLPGKRKRRAYFIPYLQRSERKVFHSSIN